MVIGISRTLIWSKTLMELIFNPCGEFRWSPEGPVSQIHSPRLPGIFSDAKVGCGKQREATAPIQSLVKLHPFFLSLRWNTCLWQTYNLGSCTCSERPNVGQNTMMMMMTLNRCRENVNLIITILTVSKWIFPEPIKSLSSVAFASYGILIVGRHKMAAVSTESHKHLILSWDYRAAETTVASHGLYTAALESSQSYILYLRLNLGLPLSKKLSLLATNRFL